MGVFEYKEHTISYLAGLFGSNCSKKNRNRFNLPCSYRVSSIALRYIACKTKKYEQKRKHIARF
jgi:hypothetical protein